MQRKAFHGSKKFAFLLKDAWAAWIGTKKLHCARTRNFIVQGQVTNWDEDANEEKEWRTKMMHTGTP